MRKKSAKSYSPKAGREVATEMRRLRSGRQQDGHPIKNRKQAIAVGLAKARAQGLKVPRARKANSGVTAKSKAA